ncbi:chromosome partitioning protein ParB, partial [Escherichia coli]|nr:chromosome partitioning protein ParB [Escherichia coli]
LIENEQRENMHPADAVRAYVALRDDGGLNAEDIAARFGHSTGHVAKLLRLGSLAPAVLDAFAADQIGMDAAKALTLSDDHAAQIEAM